MDDHWTDHAPEPVFDTVIEGRGPGANIFAIVGKARVLLRQLDIPRDRIDRLGSDVMAAKSYDEAVAIVEHWFKVRRS
jgi:hypothetical protein